jgi:hypothetical protein
MLNEGMLLARATAAIRQRGQMVSWHKLLPACRKKQGLRVYLDDNGKVSGAEAVADLSPFRMYEKDPGKSFPVLKLRTVFVSDSVPKKATELLSILQSQLHLASANGWNADMFKKLKDALHREAAVLEGLLANPNQDIEALLALCQRARRVDVQQFPLALAAWLTAEASRGSIDITKKPFSTLLLGKKQVGTNAPGVYVQFEPSGSFPLPAFHERSLIELSRRLNELDRASDASEQSEGDVGLKDAFGGPLPGYRESFPPITLPKHLGNVRLFAKAKAANCFRRYSLIDAEAFPVGRESRQQIKDAFDWAFDSTHPEREGKIWRILPSGGIGDPLLVCYVDEPQNEVTPDLGDFFYGLSREDASAISDKTYEAKAKDVLQTLDGIASRFPDAGVRVFIIAKIGKSRTQVQLSQRIAIPVLKEAARNWQNAVKNAPAVLLPAPQQTPFPEQVVDLLNTSWIMNSTVSKKTHGFKAGDGIRLLLGRGEDRIVSEALSTLVTNSYPFFVKWRQECRKGEFTERHRTRRKNEDASDNDRAWRLMFRGIPTLGILLLKLKHTKGHYMCNTPYQIGQLLALVDELHYEYCQKVRDGAIASQLLGNALMRTAYDNPQRALQTLFLRLMPYLNWAKTRKEKPWAYWSIRKLGDELRQASFGIPPSEADRAQILLGYLAKTYHPKAQSHEAGQSAEKANNQNETERKSHE